MASRVDNLAEWLSGNRLEGSSLSAATTTITGVAASNSENGIVKVVISDDTTQGDSEAGTTVEIPTTTSVKDGDEVIITNVGTEIMKKPVVTGVVGRGDEMASEIHETYSAVASAENAAKEAAVAAGAVSQHFFADDNGVHVTTEEGDATAGHNLLANSEGILMRDGEILRTAQTASGFAVYDGEGNESGNISANFSKDGITLGSVHNTHTEVNNGGIAIRLPEWDDVPDMSSFFNAGSPVFYAGTISGCPSATNSGNEPIIAFGDTAMGMLPQSYGEYSVSLGGLASGDHSFAIGNEAEASGSYSHAEGVFAKATGSCSYAGGFYSKAAGYASFAHGMNVNASGSCQSAIGKNNANNTNNLFEIGNGTSDNKRSNAFEVNNDGDTTAAGDITSGGDITATGAVNGASVNATGAVSGASVSATGAVSGNTVSSTGNMTAGGSLTAKGITSNGAVSVTGNISSSANITATTQVTAAGVRLAPVSLFSSAAGSTADTITLSQSVANFKYIEILFSDSWNGAYSSVRIKSPGSGTTLVDLSTTTAWMAAMIYNAKQVNVSGNTIKTHKDANGEPWAGQLILRTTNNHAKTPGTTYIKIHDVLGY